jgi:hypothetical protein
MRHVSTHHSDEDPQIRAHRSPTGRHPWPLRIRARSARAQQRAARARWAPDDGATIPGRRHRRPAGALRSPGRTRVAPSGRRRPPAPHTVSPAGAERIGRPSEVPRKSFGGKRIRAQENCAAPTRWVRALHQMGAPALLNGMHPPQDDSGDPTFGWLVRGDACAREPSCVSAARK